MRTLTALACTTIAVSMLAAPASARERTYCSTYSYQSPPAFYTCKDVCKLILRGATPEVRVLSWQRNVGSVHVTKVSGRDTAPLASDVTSCEGTNSAGYAPNGWQPCTMKICVTADLPVQPRSDQAHLAKHTIPPLRVIPKPKIGPPQPRLSASSSGAATNRALGGGLLEGDGGFARASPAAVGSPAGGSVGSATITSTGGSGGGLPR
jgi:hypothetical protein